MHESVDEDENEGLDIMMCGGRSGLSFVAQNRNMLEFEQLTQAQIRSTAIISDIIMNTFCGLLSFLFFFKRKQVSFF